MYKRTFLIFVAFFAITDASYKFVKYKDQLEKSKYPTNIKTLESLHEFVRLVDEYKLNVSLIASSGSNWEDNGNTKEAVAVTMTFPVGEESVTKATLNQEAFEKLAKIANQDDLTVAGTVAKNNKLTIYSNNKKGIPMSKAYKVFTGIKNGKTGFVFDEENYVAQYSFFTLGEDGKNSSTRVLHGDIDIEVVDKSDNVKDDELTKIEKSLVDAYFTYDGDVLPIALVKTLDGLFPGEFFEVGCDVGEHNYVDSDYWVTLNILNERFLIYKS